MLNTIMISAMPFGYSFFVIFIPYVAFVYDR